MLALRHVWSFRRSFVILYVFQCLHPAGKCELICHKHLLNPPRVSIANEAKGVTEQMPPSARKRYRGETVEGRERMKG